MSKLVRSVIVLAVASVGAECSATGPSHPKEAAWYRPMSGTGRGAFFNETSYRRPTPASFRGTGVPPFGRRYYGNRYFGNFNNRFYGPQYGYF